MSWEQRGHPTPPFFSTFFFVRIFPEILFHLPGQREILVFSGGCLFLLIIISVPGIRAVVLNIVFGVTRPPGLASSAFPLIPDN